MAVRAAEGMGLVFVFFVFDLDLAMNAAGLGLEDRVMTFAARRAGCRTIRRFAAHPVREVAIGAGRGHHVSLTPHRGMNAGLILNELLIVTAEASFVTFGSVLSATKRSNSASDSVSSSSVGVLSAEKTGTPTLISDSNAINYGWFIVLHSPAALAS
jgi:hypothetical protein